VEMLAESSRQVNVRADAGERFRFVYTTVESVSALLLSAIPDHGLAVAQAGAGCNGWNAGTKVAKVGHDASSEPPGHHQLEILSPVWGCRVMRQLLRIWKERANPHGSGFVALSSGTLVP